MNPEENVVHVSPTGANWDVESPAGTLAQGETKEEAIEAAHEAAAGIDATKIVVHTSDGMVEREIAAERSGS